MKLITKNIQYITSCLGKMRGTTVSTGDLGKFLNVPRMTAYGWLVDKHSPNKTTIVQIVDIIRKTFHWDITSEDLWKIDLSLKFNVDSLIEEEVSRVENAHDNNIEDNLNLVGQRLYQLRQKNELTLMEVAARVKRLFPHDETYQISHSHIRDLELGYIVNFHVNKIRALATVYGETVEYILLGKPKYSTFTYDSVNNLLVIPVNPEFAKKPSAEIKEFGDKLIHVIKAIEPDAIANGKSGRIDLK